MDIGMRMRVTSALVLACACDRRLTRHPARDKWASWSPDGRSIAFVSDRDGSEDVFLIGSDGRGLKNVTKTPALDESHPTWSPTGELTFLRHGKKRYRRALGQPRRTARALDGSTLPSSPFSYSTGPTADALCDQATWTTSSLMPSGSWKNVA